MKPGRQNGHRIDPRVVWAEGHPACNGHALDLLAEILADITRIEVIPVNSPVLIDLLALGYSDHRIIEAVRRAVERRGYGKSLAYYAAGVRDQAPDRRPLAAASQ